MAIYTYDDDFVVGSVDETELDKAEADAILEVSMLNVVDEYYIEKSVKAKTLATLCLHQLENDGMDFKYKAYIKDFDRYVSLAKTDSSTSNISTIPIARG
jgi:hypothetical protein